ncbi:uncharacterized protein LOC142975802 [Anticarsia gemmatalis]|uniref:uncharacterized protein LOC142975802 n=1 Tax=Anticarsia gemmatalis TaxID=129554 RepID=UPI003F7674B7
MCSSAKLLVILLGCMVTKTLCFELPPRPERCAAKADILYRFCCIIPPFFTRDVSKECGGGFEMLVADEKNGFTGLKRLIFSCGHWYCILNKYALITPEDYLDHEQYYVHLDTWASLNPAFADVIADAKVHCKQMYRYYMPLRVCEFFKLHMCIRNYLNVECTVTIPTKECEEQREFYKVCGTYFH